MGNKIKYILLIVTAFTEYMTLQAWLVCKNFTDVLHHSSINIPLQIDDYVHAEKGTPLLLTRIFTNKLTDGSVDLLRFYFQFWDIRFGTNWFSLVGYFGIFAAFYYIISNKQKKIYHWLTVIIIVLLPWIEIVIEPHVSLLIKSLYLWLPFTLFSLYGIYLFLCNGKFRQRLIILSVLIIISLLWITFLPQDMPRYCMK